MQSREQEISEWGSGMMDGNTPLQHFLEKRRADLSLRSLPDKAHLVDFCSNDYLGFSRSALLREKIRKALDNHPHHPQGSTGSRLITGNHPLFEELETYIARYHRAEAGLIFNSGYDANTGFFSSVPQKNDMVLFDELIHASVRDGLKLTRGAAVEFRHNDVEDVKSKLNGAYENIYIAVESVYSMDGDFAPLKEFAEICSATGARLVVDEAHATGVFGHKGEGRVAELGLENHVFARIHTFSKALGCNGAIVLGSAVLRQFLVNFARPFIFTTALPFHSLVAIQCAYDMLERQQGRVAKIKTLIQLLRQSLADVRVELLESESPIQCIVLPGNERALALSRKLEEAGFYAKAILYPTVPRGRERIRIALHSFNTPDEIAHLAAVIRAAVS